MPKIIATKDDWIQLGYKRFSEKGINGLIIEQMADQLKVNKSSFYWHFSSKHAFIESIINHWEEDSTSSIIEMVNRGESPKQKFQHLVQLSFKKDNRLDFFFFLKKYAQSHRALKRRIDLLDQQRIDFTQRLLQDLGFTKTDATIKARIFYQYLIGYHEMIRYKRQSKDYLNQVMQEINHFIPH